ncbi:MAG: DUF2975 domain-containing protein [Fimbriimonas sp.]
MSRTAPSAALPIAQVVLRLLIVLNWFTGAAIFVLLALSPNARWIMSAFDLAPSPDTDRLIWGLRAIAFIGLCSIPLHNLFLKRLLEIVDTVGVGDAFVAANAVRLRAMAWTLLILQCVSIVIGAIANAVSTSAHPLHLDAGFSITGWLAVLLTFLLAQVFAEGSQMREDLEGTV